MRKLVSTAALVGFGLVSSLNWAQAKTTKDCTAEWRADKANFQAKGITEKAYVADCRSQTDAAPPTASAPAPTVAAPAPRPIPPASRGSDAGQKTAKACIEEWRADKANFQAKGVTQKAYVADCRAGTVSAPSAAPAPAPAAAAPPPRPAGAASAPTAAAPAPSTAAPAPMPSASRPIGQSPYGTTERGPSTGSPAGAGQFANEAQAKAACPGDTVVWVNLRSKIYHFAGTHNYGNTKDGAYICERDTVAQGMRAAKNEEHP
jgi:hypothetical protein